MLRQLDHRGVVEVLDAGRLPDGRPFLVMPLLDGETLASRIERGPLPFDEALVLLDTLADAVGAIHDAGLVHRDIKPENVFLVDGQPVLLDFGIAKGPSGNATTTETGLVRGTIAVMAPERFFGKPATSASDIYELAVTFYAALTGVLPWDDPQHPDARLAPTLPSEHGVALPEAVEDELLSALSTRAERRPETARAFADAIRVATEDTSAPEGQPSTTVQDRKAEPSDAAVAGETNPPAAPTGPTKPRSDLWVVAGVALAVSALLIGMQVFSGEEPRTTVADGGVLQPSNPDLTAVGRVVVTPPDSSAAAPSASAAPSSTASSATVGSAGACERYRDLLCSDPFTREGGWKAMCLMAKELVEDSRKGSDAERDKAKKTCRDALPQTLTQRKYLMALPKNPKGDASMPACQQLVAIWCDPSLGAFGAKRCAQARDRLTIKDPKRRKIRDKECVQQIPSEKLGAEQMLELREETEKKIGSEAMRKLDAEAKKKNSPTPAPSAKP
jgi:serine/threonine-protein kinase